MTEPRYATMALDDWKARAVDGAAPTDVQLRKTLVFEKAEDVADEPNTVRIIITTSARDRQRDVIESAGWNLTDYLHNPVVLWAHDYGQPPVARSPRLEQQPDRVIGMPEFTPRELYPFGAMIGQMVRQGFINAASVGFQPDEFSFDEQAGGVHFLKQTLLEFSMVPIPANAGALVEARAAGIDLSPLKAWAEQALDLCEGAGLWVPRADLEVAYCTLNDGKLISLPSSEVILRSGRVLSAKNEGTVRQAISAIEAGIQQLQGVLEQLPAAEDTQTEASPAAQTQDLPVADLPAVSLSQMERNAPSSPLSEQALDGEYIELADEPDEERIDITRDELASLIREQFRASLMAVTGRLD